MGNLCTSCCNQSSSCEDLTPDLEVRRQKQREAAERNIAKLQNRGIKNVEAVNRQKMLDQQRERREEEASKMNENPTLKWQVS
ncbi:small VCP/p97-interacting protein [Hylaeus anthracinus]|uniref:small VCP/p97-interacting protein n=1 Tax=Hylaeus anthracinus TaxID=313031 RepID=UPI0023B932F2|nr:small VCP/p97-interacting protein [Hylaeus anthracinus]